MFRNVFKYSLLRIARQKEVLFWSLAFPIILSTLFFFAFQNLDKPEVVRAIPIAYVEGETKDAFVDVKDILGQVTLSDDKTKMFTITDATMDEARQLVTDKKAAAAVIGGAKPQLMVDKVSKDQVVIKQVLEQVLSTKNTVTAIAVTKFTAPFEDIARDINTTNVISPVDLSGEDMSRAIVYFFSLLAMTCMGAASAGALVVVHQQANRSSQGARAAASPTGKWLRVFASGLATYVVQLAMSFIVLAYLIFVLGKNFGSNLPYVVLITSVGTLLGVTMGMVIGAVSRGSEGTVIGISVAVYMLSSSITGLMSDMVKRMVDLHAPLVARYNPASIVVNALYSLYYHGRANMSYVYRGLLVSVFFMGVVALFLRRRYHDSL